MTFRLGLILAGVAAAGVPASTAHASVDVARLSFVEGDVQVASGRKAYAAASEGSGFQTNTRLRTGKASLARLDFPFMSLLASAGTEVDLSGSVLFLGLVRGRIEVASKEAEIVKIQAGDAEVRGEGWAVVRRHSEGVVVSAIEGRFGVNASGMVLSLKGGEGAVIAPGQAPRFVAFGERPRIVYPGADAVYVGRAEPLDLTWIPPGQAHVQVLPIESDQVLMERDVDGAKTQLEIPWPGLYRWRVALRNPSGVEGAPSTEGLICVMEK